MMQASLDRAVDSSGQSRVFGIWSYLYRGILGATFGYFVMTTYFLYRDSYLRLFLWGFIFFLWLPILYGGLVGLSLWQIQRQWGGLKLLTRACFGVTITTLLGFPYIYFLEYRMQASNALEIKRIIVDLILLGFVIGLPAGLMTPSHRKKTEVEVKRKIPADI